MPEETKQTENPNPTNVIAPPAASENAIFQNPTVVEGNTIVPAVLSAPYDLTMP